MHLLIEGLTCRTTVHGTSTGLPRYAPSLYYLYPMFALLLCADAARKKEPRLLEAETAPLVSAAAEAAMAAQDQRRLPTCRARGDVLRRAIARHAMERADGGVCQNTWRGYRGAGPCFGLPRRTHCHRGTWAEWTSRAPGLIRRLCIGTTIYCFHGSR